MKVGYSTNWKYIILGEEGDKYRVEHYHTGCPLNSKPFISACPHGELLIDKDKIFDIQEEL